MKTKYKYIEFREWKALAVGGRKTSTWDCINRKHKTVLGVVQWYGPWRQYVYLPYPDTVLSPDCLRDIAEFMEQFKTGRKKG